MNMGLLLGTQGKGTAHHGSAEIEIFFFKRYAVLKKKKRGKKRPCVCCQHV